MTSNVHTTNYHDTFIEVAPDCPIRKAEVPPRNEGKETVASIEYEMVSRHPYAHTSDDVLFHILVVKNNISKPSLDKERQKFFSKGQPCFRSSPLAKRYGWGIHSDSKGKIALYALESGEYKRFAKAKNLQHLKAMRSKRV